MNAGFQEMACLGMWTNKKVIGKDRSCGMDTETAIFYRELGIGMSLAL